MSLSLSRALPFRALQPLGSGLSFFLKEARRPRLLLARPRSLRVERFTVAVTSALAHVPLLSNSRRLPSFFSRARELPGPAFISLFITRVSINLSYAALLSRPALSIDVDVRLSRFLSCRTAINRNVHAASWRDDRSIIIARRM